MNLLQHCLLKLSEECNEVGQITSKCMQFGLLEKHPELAQNNKERLHEELNDLYAMVQLLNDEFNLEFEPDQLKIQTKIEKVKHYLNYSVSLGLVTLDKK